MIGVFSITINDEVYVHVSDNLHREMGFQKALLAGMVKSNVKERTGFGKYERGASNKIRHHPNKRLQRLYDIYQDAEFKVEVEIDRKNIRAAAEFVCMMNKKKLIFQPDKGIPGLHSVEITNGGKAGVMLNHTTGKYHVAFTIGKRKKVFNACEFETCDEASEVFNKIFVDLRTNLPDEKISPY